MNRLILVLLLLLGSRPIRAADDTIYVSQLPRTNVLGTNYIVIHVPSLVGSTNDMWLAPVDALYAGATSITIGTNIIRFTNECYVTANVNTNALVVSGAGTASANGTYTNSGGLTPLFTKPSTVHGIWFDGLDWLLTNSAGTTLYSISADNPTGTWTIVSGVAPAPSDLYDSVTNCFLNYLASANVAMPVLSSNLYVNADIGNDTNALRGRQDRPWKNLQAALANQRYGDTVYIGPGNYPEVAGYGVYFNVSNRVRLIGAGRDVTFIGTRGPPDESIRCASEVVLRDFTTYALPNFGALGITSTNPVMDNVHSEASADGVYISAYEGVITIRNSLIDSDFDGVADWENRPGGSNRVIRIYNSGIRCGFYPGGGVSGNPRRCLEGGDTRFEMYGGFLDCRNGSLANACVRLDVETLRTNKSGSILLRNVALYHSSTNSAISQMVTNFYGLPILLDNCTMETVTGTLINGSYTNKWSDRLIAIQNASTRTNRLPPISSLTNSLMAATAEGHTKTIFDDLRTASGTNIFILPSGTDKINLNLSQTNITADGGTMTLGIRSNSWQIISRFP